MHKQNQLATWPPSTKIDDCPKCGLIVTEQMGHLEINGRSYHTTGCVIPALTDLANKRNKTWVE